MAKTRNDARTVYEHIKLLRPCVEFKVLKLLQQFEKGTPLLHSCVSSNNAMVLPAVMRSYGEMACILRNERYLVKEEGTDGNYGGWLRSVRGSIPDGQQGE